LHAEIALDGLGVRQLGMVAHVAGDAGDLFLGMLLPPDSSAHRVPADIFSGNFPLSMKWALLRPTHGCFRAAIAVLRTPVLVAGQEWIASRLITQNQQRGVVRPTDTQFVVGAGRLLSEQDLVFGVVLIACRFPPPRQKSFKTLCRCDESVNFNHPSMHCRARPPSYEFSTTASRRFS
jgi:hypothetical protein